MSESGFYMDTTKFDEDFKRLIKEAIPGLAAQGLFDAGQELLTAAEDEAPQTPYKTGDLRSSREVLKPEIGFNNIVVEVGYNCGYAAAVHEMDVYAHLDPLGMRTTGWTRTQVSQPGPKFIEAKMAKDPDRFMKVAADYILEHGGK